MYDENSIWFSQNLLFHKDKTEGTDSIIQVSISVSSKDFISFSIPTLRIQISNNFNKSCILNYDKALDFEYVTQEIIQKGDLAYIEKIEVMRKYNNNQSFTLKCVRNQNDQNVVKVTIRSNETDFVDIVISERLLGVISRITSQFTKNYISIADGLVLRSISYQLTKFDELIREVKGIQSRIEGAVSAPQPEIKMPIGNIAIDELDKFLGKDMENIKIPTIENDNEKAEKVESPPTEVNSKFVEKILSNDLHKLESMVNVGNIDSFFYDVEQVYETGTILLGGVEGWDRLVYFSKLYSDLTINNATNKSGPIPSGFPILKFDIENPTQNNLDLAYDLFLFTGYIRAARRRLENHYDDVFFNLAVMHLKLRTCTDPLVYSFITKKTKEQLVSIISNRFDYYKSIGVFKHYEDKLNDSNCAEITKSDLVLYVEETCEKGFDTPYFDEFYRSAMETYNLRMGTKDNFNLEQIINEIVPLEIKEKLGQEITLEDFSEVSKEVHELFTSKEKPKEKPKSKANIEKINPIQMYVKTFKDHVPEDHIENLISYLEDYTNRKIDFNNFPFPIEDFGEFVIKGLFFWDPDKYKNASALKDVIDDPMTKDLILARINEKLTEKKDDLGFSNLMENFEL